MRITVLTIALAATLAVVAGCGFENDERKAPGSFPALTGPYLGQTPPEAESLAAFKEKWGGMPYAYPCYTSQSLLGRIR